MDDTITLRPFLPEDAGWLTRQHGMLYARDEGFDPSFEALVARVLDDFIARHDPGREAGWIARTGPARLGSIFCVATDRPAVARLRLFLLRPQARGRGLGRRMLHHCMDFARSAGYRQLVLATHESHRAACALYRAEGFTMTDSRATRSFGQDVVEQHFAITL
ncbi:GNAT family N-acetyltransferase [Oceaniglobus trochenteri]|uniref:GNAT family N-acetyltransferase n=1 Tax=Oceaniglobus trochenteri TaxID=2763260 RepID=UPI001CFFBDE4|nr:GNAT family N-acetyltransferase [Oceaniglobus trochenteri]